VRAAVGFIAVLILALPRIRTIRVPARALPFFAAYGVLGFALFGLIFFAALERTTVSIAVVLLYTAPAFVVLLSAVLWRERFAANRIIALLLALVGVVLVTGAAGAVLAGKATLSFPALLFGLGAGLGYAVYTLFSKVATERHGAFASLFWSFAFAAAALALLASPITPFLRSPDHTLLLLALGIVPTMLPYGLYLIALRHLRASTAAMLASLEPAVAALLAALLLNERLDAWQLVGMSLIVAAAVLLARRPAPAAHV